MKRKIESFLENWTKRPDRLPLLIFGARQIGKTYSIKRFAEQQFDDYLYLNFEENIELADLFGSMIDAATCLRNLELFFDKKLYLARQCCFLTRSSCANGL